MPEIDRPIDPLPDDFESEEAAAEFWDTHSITDYEEFLEPVGLQVNVNRRHFEIEVDEECFMAVRDTAKKTAQARQATGKRDHQAETRIHLNEHQTRGEHDTCARRRPQGQMVGWGRGTFRASACS